VEPRFCVQNSRERFPYCLIFPNNAARDEICVFCRLIFSETEKHIPFQVSDNQIDGNQRGIADDVSKIVIGKETRCIHVAADKLGHLIPQLRTLPTYSQLRTAPPVQPDAAVVGYDALELPVFADTVGAI